MQDKNQKMTIHRALSELKMLDKRINKKTDTLQVVSYYQPSEAGVQDKLKEFETQAKAEVKSIEDLINRKVKIKSAIVLSNASTSIKVAGKTMTVADAITYKEIVSYKTNLADEILNQYNTAMAAVNRHNAKVEEDAKSLAEKALQKDNIKVSDTDAMAVIEPYVERKRIDLTDPLKAEKYSQKLQEEIDEFLSEVDAVLSESNALTTIEI